MSARFGLARGLPHVAREFRFYAAYSRDFLVPAALRENYEVIVWVNLRAAHNLGYVFTLDGTGTLISHGISDWRSPKVIARVELSSTM